MIFPRQWFPIETAPKDGRIIDLWCVNINGDGYRQPDCRWHQAQEVWKSQHYNGAGYNRMSKQVPTHWRYAPEPPPFEEWKTSRYQPEDQQ